MLIAGRVGDIWGHKRLFLAGWLWLSLWSLLAGLSVYSHSLVFFSICRALQGVGSAVMAPISLAIIGSVYREGHRKNIAFSIYAAGAPAGFAIGAVFSALLAQLAFWPWAYYLAAIICCVFTVLTFVSVPDLEHGTDVDPAQRPKGIQTFDWLGAFTGVSGLILFNVAWNRAPAVGWQSAQAIAPLIIGIALFVAFLFAEKRARQPLLPISQISTDAAWVLLIVALGWASFGVLVFYLATFLLEIQQNTMLIVAAKYCPVPVTGLIASLLASILMKKGVRTAWLLAIALLWFCVPSVLVATAPVDQLYWRQIFWAFLLCPFGMDISFPTATVMVSNLVRRPPNPKLEMLRNRFRPVDIGYESEFQS